MKPQLPAAEWDFRFLNGGTEAATALCYEWEFTRQINRGKECSVSLLCGFRLKTCESLECYFPLAGSEDGPTSALILKSRDLASDKSLRFKFGWKKEALNLPRLAQVSGHSDPPAAGVLGLGFVFPKIESFLHPPLVPLWC